MTTDQRPYTALVQSVKSNPQLVEKLKADPVETLETINETSVQPAYIGDKWIYRGVVFILGTIVILAAIGYLWLSFYGKDAPQALVALGFTAIGAIGGLLASPPTTHNK